MHILRSPADKCQLYSSYILDVEDMMVIAKKKIKQVLRMKCRVYYDKRIEDAVGNS
jgi:hypothetical protein